MQRFALVLLGFLAAIVGFDLAIRLFRPPTTPIAADPPIPPRGLDLADVTTLLREVARAVNPPIAESTTPQTTPGWESPSDFGYFRDPVDAFLAPDGEHTAGGVVPPGYDPRDPHAPDPIQEPRAFASPFADG